MNNFDLKDKIREIKDFPKKGIGYKDITTLLQDGKAFKQSIKNITDLIGDQEVDIVVGPEARGFIYGAPVAYEIEAGFVPIRKPNKLPGEVLSVEYELEYGSDKIEIHTGSIKKGDKVIIVDDLLATGGTSKAAIELIEKAGGIVVGLYFLIELEFLNGRESMNNYNIKSLIKYN